jgi:hypothetical protein
MQLSTGGDTGFATSALMEIADMSTFNQFGQDMIHAHSLSWRLSGTARTPFAALRTHPRHQ